MPKSTNKSAHTTGLRSMLERVVPFLFHAQKPKRTHVHSKAKSPGASRKHRVKARKPRTMKHPATTISVRKHVAHKTVKAAVPASAESLLELELEEAPDAQHSATADVNIAKKEDPTPLSSLGVILVPEDKPAKPTESELALLADKGSDSFLKKVVKSGSDAETKPKKISGWSILKSRFFSRSKEAKPISKPAAQELTEKEMADDSFLRRVQKKRATDVVGTAIDDTEETIETVEKQEGSSGLEEFASGKTESATKSERPKGRILSAADLRKETIAAKEATDRLAKDVKDIKEEMRMREKDKKKTEPEVEKKPEPETTVVRKQVVHKKKNGFQKFLGSVGHIGLGKERMAFIQNLATMLNAGLPLIDAIKTLQLETRTKPMKKVLQHIIDSIENGSPLWRAMEQQDLFSLHALALVRIGEESGSLAQNVEYLALQEEKDHELRSKVKMAMIYPSIVMVIMLVIVVGLGMFVLPNLIGVLYSLNVPLPFVTRMVIAFSNMFTNYGAIVVPGMIAGFVLIIILAKFTPLKVVFQWVLFRVPGVGALARQATIARFGVILGGLLKAGVPVIEAMQSLVDVTPIVSYRKLYVRMLDHITIGDSFAKSFSSIPKSHKLLPPSVQQLVITGEKSGALADIMLKVADIYDKKASETAQKLPVILEPMLLLFIGGLVGTIAFSIIVPIYSIVGTIGQ